METTAIIPADQQQTLTRVDQQRIDQNPAAVYIASLATGSRPTTISTLSKIAEMLTGSPDLLACQWSALRYQHTTAIRARLAETHAPGTTNKMMTLLNGVIKTAWSLDQMTTDEYVRATSTKRTKGESPPAGRELTPGEINALMVNCQQDNSPINIRDGAIIALLYSAGLRRSELISLDLDDYETETGTIKIRGKRNKIRLVYINDGAYDALLDWLEIRGTQPGALFHPINRGGNITPRRLSNEGITRLLKLRADKAGVKDFTPHDLRRTFISDLLEKGADIATVSRLAGHSDINTTARYDRRPEDEKRKAAEMLHVPYTRRTE